MTTRVLVRAEVNPTEDEAKVREAVTNLTGSDRFGRVTEGRRLLLVQEGESDLLTHLRGLLRRERILDAARKIMQRSIQGTTITIFLNKQVAHAGHVSFCRRWENPLWGPYPFTSLTTIRTH